MALHPNPKSKGGVPGCNWDSRAGVRYFAETFAAPADHFDLLFQAQKFFDDRTLQFEGAQSRSPAEYRVQGRFRTSWAATAAIQDSAQSGGRPAHCGPDESRQNKIYTLFQQGFS